jgi:hypothetical protein
VVDGATGSEHGVEPKESRQQGPRRGTGRAVGGAEHFRLFLRRQPKGRVGREKIGVGSDRFRELSVASETVAEVGTREEVGTDQPLGIDDEAVREIGWVLLVQARIARGYRSEFAMRAERPVTRSISSARFELGKAWSRIASGASR